MRNNPKKSQKPIADDAVQNKRKNNVPTKLNSKVCYFSCGGKRTFSFSSKLPISMQRSWG